MFVRASAILAELLGLASVTRGRLQQKTVWQTPPPPSPESEAVVAYIIAKLGSGDSVGDSDK